MARMPADSCAVKVTDFTHRSQTIMQENSTSTSLYGVSEKQTNYLHSNKYVLHLPPLPRSVEKVLGIETVSETVHIDTHDLSEALFSNDGIKRAHGSDDSSTTTSGYESDDEDEANLQESFRKKQRTESNNDIYKKRALLEDKRRAWNPLHNGHSKAFGNGSTVTCFPDSKSSQNSSASSSTSESSSTSSSGSDCNTESSSSDACSADASDAYSSDTSDACSSDSSDDSLMDTYSDSCLSSLGLSLSDTSSSEDNSTDADDSKLNYASSCKRLIPKVICCPKSCVCKTGCSSPLTPIPRRGGVVTPLYKRLLTCRLLNAANVSKSDCCDRSCYVYWLQDIRNNS